jgi:hypothetical protein
MDIQTHYTFKAGDYKTEFKVVDIIDYGNNQENR